MVDKETQGKQIRVWSCPRCQRINNYKYRTCCGCAYDASHVELHVHFHTPQYKRPHEWPDFSHRSN